MTFGIGIVLGTVIFSLIFSLLSTIRDSRPGQTAYEVLLNEVANDNIVPNPRKFPCLA